MKKCRNCLREEIEFASAELHYTRFTDAEVFERLCRRHGLKRLRDVTGENTPATLNHAWAADDGLMLFTNADPVAATHPDARATGREGYCSYLTIDGPAGAAEMLFRDVVEAATNIKGEFTPLTTDSGEVIVSYWDIHETKTHRERLEDKKAYAGVPDGAIQDARSTWWGEFFAELATPKPSYELVVQLSEDGFVPIENTKYEGPREIPDGVAWKYREVDA